MANGTTGPGPLEGRRRRVLVLLLLAGVPALLTRPGHALEVGDQAPEIHAPKWLNSKPLKLKEISHKIVVVEFWATWCPPCRKSIPHLAALHKKYSEEGVVVIGLTKETGKKVRDFVAAQKIPYAIGTGSPSGRRYGVRGIPHAFLIAPGGEIVWTGNPLEMLVYSDGKKQSKLDQMVKRALKLTPPREKLPDPLDVFVLKDGRRIAAKNTVDVGDSYFIKTESGKTLTVKKAEVKEIVKGGGGGAGDGEDDADRDDDPGDAGDGDASPGRTLPEYVLADGTRISAKNVMDAGDEYVIKDEAGKMRVVKKKDVVEILEADTPAPKPSAGDAGPAPKRKPRKRAKKRITAPRSIPRHKLLVKNTTRVWIRVRISGQWGERDVAVPAHKTIPTILPAGKYEFSYEPMRGVLRKGSFNLSGGTIITLVWEK